MKKITTLFVFFTLTFNAMSQESDIKIPDGVVYKKASKEVNQKAEEILKKELSDPEYVLFDKLIYCGPNFWNQYSHLPIEKGNIIFKVPQPDGSLIDKQGKLIQTIDDFKILWDQLVKDLNGQDYVIRKINEPELKYFWSIIFYDIEEPLFVIDSKDLKIIVDFYSNGKILMIENL